MAAAEPPLGPEVWCRRAPLFVTRGSKNLHRREGGPTAEQSQEWDRDTHLAVGGRGLKGGRPDPLWGDNGGRLREPLVIHWGVLLLFSAAATEPLSQAADAQKG